MGSLMTFYTLFIWFSYA